MFRLFLLGVLIAFVAACAGGRFSSPQATGFKVAQPIQCVPFARDASGIQIYGNAHTWWDQARGRYERGYRPQVGAVMVLSRTQAMTHGHLAVVRRVLGARHIEVTHSNWGNDRHTRRYIYESMRVEDISPANDWSRVRFWNYHIGAYGQPYPVRGFIYNRPARHDI